MFISFLELYRNSYDVKKYMKYKYTAPQTTLKRLTEYFFNGKALALLAFTGVYAVNATA